MKKAILIGIVVVVAIGIVITAIQYYGLSQNEQVETEDASESKPKQFSIELNEGIGISDKQP